MGALYKNDVQMRLSTIAWRMWIACLVPVCMAGCKTKYVAVPEYHYSDSVRTEYVRDSIIRHDSVYVNTYTQGDTVYLTKVVTRDTYKDRIVHDTLRLTLTDSVRVPLPTETKSEVYKMRRWQAFFFDLGVVVCLIGVGYIILWIIKAVRK